MPKVSAIVAIYKVEKYIERCAVSLFEQTLDDIQYIFVDDCTPDKSMDILQQVMELYPNRKGRVTICHHEHNQGIAAARKTGLNEAQGQYVIFCDSDDWVDKEMYRLMYEKAIEENDDIVSCGWISAKSSSSFGGGSLEDFSSEVETAKDYVRELLLNKKSPFLVNKLVKRTLFNQKILFPIANAGEDMCLVCQLYYYSTRIGHVSKKMYYYYQNPTSITHSMDQQKTIDFVNNTKANFELVCSFLGDDFLAYQAEIESHRYWIKNWMRHAVQTTADIHLWKDVYPELNNPFHRNHYFKRRDRIMALLMDLGVYPWVKKIIRG